MEETLVSFEVAKLAKEKGFTDVVGVFRGKHYYNYKGELDADQIDYLKAYVRQEDTSLMESIAAPTQSLLQRWLREEHRVHLTVIHRAYSGLDMIDEYDYLLQGTEVVYRHFKSYEEALEAGLKEALKLI